MKKIIFTIIILIITSVNSFAENAKFSIFFVNGMFNSKQDAKMSRDFLEEKIRNELNSDINITFHLAYNQQELQNIGNPGTSLITTAIGQLFELSIQKGLDNYTKLWKILDGSEIAPDWMVDASKKLASLANDISYVVDFDLQKHIDKYMDEINKGRIVIIVSHSQGNLYANRAYEFLAIDRLEIVAIATPANFVAGDNNYVTLKKDIIIESVIDSLPQNTSNTTSQKDWTGHSFTKSYLEGDVSGPKILNYIVEIIKSYICVDEDRDGYYTGGICGGALDCDDFNSNIHPNQSEICNDNLDNNCNGEIDEGCEPELEEINIYADNNNSQDSFARLTIWSNGNEQYSGYNTEYLQMKYDAGRSEERALLYISLEEIPDSSKIISAQLKLYGYAISNYVNAVPRVYLGKLLGLWPENISWEIVPESDNLTNTLFENTGINSWHEWNVTDYVQDCVNGQWQNFGFVLYFQNQNEINAKFYSSEYEEADKRPKLEIIYEK